MANRLASATSPYLLQHAENPVDWREWGPEAFEEARRTDRPILLSVGYAACHWCHVMAHESFEDAATAAVMNEHFVNVKVDREERPDVDAVYMNAVQAMTGNGGWPMTCVLDHAGRPFFAGTYFPDQPRHGQASFTQILAAVTDAWRTRREQIDRAGEQVAEHLAQTITMPAATLGEAELDAAVDVLVNEFDPMAGGFGGAPKFPPSMTLEHLRLYAARAEGSERGRQAGHMLARTLQAMAGSGMYDQLGGGFARYAVDRGWVVPHFEKMLYDNAQLLGLYARAGHHRIAVETADFMLRELRTSQGGFASALDADSDGAEGTFYVWTPAELTQVLGDEDGAWVADLCGVSEDGTFEHGTSTLQLRHAPRETEAQRWQELRARLLEHRETRTRPARDDKVVTGWNGLAIRGLCEAGSRCGRPDYLEAAVAAADLLLGTHLVEGQLRRVSRDGVVGAHRAVLEDHALLADGLLALVQATGEARWLTAAQGLLDQALAHFRAEDGGFHDTADDAESLVARPREFGDNASPCGQSAMVHALTTYAALTGEGSYRTAAEETLAVLAGLATRAPRFAGWALAAAELHRAGPIEIAVVGQPGRARDRLMAQAHALNGAVVVVGVPGVEGVPLLANRTELAGQPAAYVCRDLVCERPVTEL